MNKRILSLITLVFITLFVTGKDLTRYRVWLTDKAKNSYSIEQPEKFLSAKAIERRAKRNIEITEQDLPVSNVYLQQIKEQGFNIFVTSRWMNTVVVAPTDSAKLDSLKQLPFVKEIECVQNNKSSFPFYAPETPNRVVAERN